MADDAQKVESLTKWLLDSNSKCQISTSLHVKETNYGGKGIFAISDVKPYQQIMKISHNHLINFTTIVSHISSFNSAVHLPTSYKHIKVSETKSDRITQDLYSKLTLDQLLQLSSFQIVSMYLVLESIRGENSYWKHFLNTLPVIDDFKLSPLFWRLNEHTTKLYNKLPPTTKAHADKISQKFDLDYSIVKDLLTKYNLQELLTKKFFLWAWMSTNSRCLYMEIPQGKDRDDNFTMAPYVDFINHSSSDHCSLKIDRNGFFVSTTSKYVEGDELYLCYGPHSNDFLLCEYAFILPKNDWNDVDLTDSILKLFDEKQKEFLREKGYFGEYTINKDSVSFRTEVALAILEENVNDLYTNRRINALLNGYESSFYNKSINRRLKTLLNGLIDKFEEYASLEESDDIYEKIIGQLYREKCEIMEYHLQKIDNY
ncbi:hypothetical protein WICMUC_002140 [Wickerhamomyces mucosus]|uniref:SET domain-containing protein n=1 Tax=Wickerhamomyces mucosus TaxID=1378264 RepID=A0A9P8TE74_9ASCO|nr:hypothetical protein WICMUC_002140 [Wickerhamomyces mucosus]